MEEWAGGAGMGRERGEQRARESAGVSESGRVDVNAALLLSGCVALSTWPHLSEVTMNPHRAL